MMCHIETKICSTNFFKLVDFILVDELESFGAKPHHHLSLNQSCMHHVVDHFLLLVSIHYQFLFTYWTKLIWVILVVDYPLRPLHTIVVNLEIIFLMIVHVYDSGHIKILSLARWNIKTIWPTNTEELDNFSNYRRIT